MKMKERVDEKALAAGACIVVVRGTPGVTTVALTGKPKAKA
jgi:hypothetical protein